MRSFLALTLFLFPAWLLASVQVGTGLSSSMSGRLVPGLEVGLGGESWRATFNMVGVQSSYYYHSSYATGLYRTWKSGPFLWAEVESGLGAGMMYALRGFQDEGSTQEQEKTDFVLGPAFYLQWNFASPVYLKLEMVWGIRGVGELIGLNGQDVIFLSLGVRPW